MAKQKSTKQSHVYGWWFAKEAKLPIGDGREVKIGEALSVDGPIELCKHGLHASRKILDAAGYAQGSLLYRVCMSGTIVHVDDKMAASTRRHLWMIDSEKALRLAAAEIAFGALMAERKRGREPDPRSWAAVEAARGYASGTIAKTEMSAAWSAADSAAWSAAWSAAESAAWSAAESAAWSAARSAARSAAESAAEKICIKHVMAAHREAVKG
jgi:hypothetical protein